MNRQLNHEQARENCLTAKQKVKIKVIPTEIYSRVVGYYRPVQNWNKGKVEEFSERKLIDPEKPIRGSRPA